VCHWRAPAAAWQATLLVCLFTLTPTLCLFLLLLAAGCKCCQIPLTGLNAPGACGTERPEQEHGVLANTFIFTVYLFLCWSLLWRPHLCYEII
jgi:hypothetical protein